MLDVLKAKPGGDELPVRLGNFRDLQGGPYGLVYAVYNSFCYLLDQEDQIQCLANIAPRLTPGGTLLIETTLSPAQGSGLSVEEISDERVVLHIGSYDSTSQLMSAATVISSKDGLQTYPNQMRHTPPAELDLMARLAGLALKERWGTWTGDPVTPDSSTVISLYQPQSA